MAYASELLVITKAKDLCSYIMTITEKSPKRFRFTLVSRLQNYGLDIWEIRQVNGSPYIILIL